VILLAAIAPITITNPNYPTSGKIYIPGTNPHCPCLISYIIIEDLILSAYKNHDKVGIAHPTYIFKGK